MSDSDSDHERGPGTKGLPQAIDALAVIPGPGQALQFIGSLIPAVAQERARQTLDGVLAVIERDEDWLTLELQRRSKAVHLIGRAMKTWLFDDDETFEAKREAYRRILQRGIVDDASIDAGVVQLEVVGEMTFLDLRAMQVIEALVEESQHPVVRGVDVAEQLGAELGVVQAVLGHLSRMSLTQPAGLSWGEVDGDGDTSLPSTLRITAFGLDVLSDLRGPD